MIQRAYDKLEIPYMLDEGAFAPEKAHEDDAGYDIRTPFGFLLDKKATIDTGVHVLIPPGYVGMLKAKSGLNVNFDIVGEGVVDAGYTGSIKVKLYDLDYTDQKSAYYFERGDKIIQLVIMPIPRTSMKQVKRFEKTDRGNNGFGSTGR